MIGTYREGRGVYWAGGDKETEGEGRVYRVRRQRVYRVGCDEETEHERRVYRAGYDEETEYEGRVYRVGGDQETEDEGWVYRVRG